MGIHEERARAFFQGVPLARKDGREGNKMYKETKESQWEEVVRFHGHICGGLTIGYKAASYAKKLLGIAKAADEEVVCIAENDACGVDAISVVLGCTVGRGNLLFHKIGKQAFSIYRRDTGESVRLVLKKLPRPMDKEDAKSYYLQKMPSELFDVKETTIPLPEKAKIFRSKTCAVCQEETMEQEMISMEGQLHCKDCCKPYNRFQV